MQLVFNELSADFTLYDYYSGIALLNDFVDTYSLLARRTSCDIVLLSSFFNVKLSQGYTTHHYRNDKNIEKRYRDMFRSMLNRANTLDESEYSLSECLIPEYHNKPAVGCLVAYETEGNVISFKSHDLWKCDQIQGRYLSVDEVESMEERINITIPNVSSLEQSKNLANNYIDEELLLISSGQDLWDNRERLYPSLCFCDSVRTQLSGMQRMQIQQIKKRLTALETYFKDFEGIFDADNLGLKARSESESVKVNKQYMQQRVFHTPYGDDRFFHWHISFTGSYAGRIYFDPDVEKNTCIIGYIGKHLPTSQYSTM